MALPRIFIVCLLFFSASFLFSQNNGIVLKNTETPVLKFEENKNQFDSKVLYEADLIKSGKVFLEKNTFTYLFWNAAEIEQMHHPADGTDPSSWTNGVTVHFHCLKAEFLNANADVNVDSKFPAAYYKNYFVGND